MSHEVNEAIERLATRLREQVPELAYIMDRAKAGFLSEEEAMVEMMAVASKPEVTERIMAAATRDLATLKPTNEDLAEVGDYAFFTGRGLPQLNPLVEAALIERAQFDDDIPELRTGPLPEGVKPAVSVKTTARDPVVLGRMLQQASEEVGQRLVAHERERLKGIEGIAEDKNVLALLEEGGHSLALIEQVIGSSDTDLPEYRRGAVPAPVEVPKPEARALAVMTPQERREAAWKFLSTTQGRRSAIETIRSMVATNLRGAGIEVVEQEYDPQAPERDVIAYHEWSVGLSGPSATQPSFALVDTAAKALYRGLVKDTTPGTQVHLEVVAVNTVDVRTVGWAARLLR